MSAAAPLPQRSAFERKLGAAKRLAPKTFSLLPEHFAEKWGNRPVAPITLGLRVPSERDYEIAVAEAEKVVEELTGEKAAAAYNRSLVLFVVARGICSPHDVNAPHPYFELPDDELPMALKPNALRRIFDEIELLAVDQSPVFPEASVEDVHKLLQLLQTDDPFERVDRVKHSRCLRYLRLVLDTLTENG